MAKNELKTLIRVHQFELDEKQRQMGNLLRFEQSLVNRKALLAKRFKEEEKAASLSAAAAITFGMYVDWNIAENKRVDKALADAREEIAALRDEIIDAFREVKTLQIAQENRDKKELAELEHKMNAMLDEIGLTLYRRKIAEEQDDENRTKDEKNG